MYIERQFVLNWPIPESQETRALAVLIYGPESERIAGMRTLVLCHGLGSGKRNRLYLHLASVAQRLSLRLIAFDFEGHFESEGEARDLTLRRAVSQLRTVVASPQVEPLLGEAPVILGSSFGATAAMLFQFATETFAKVVLRSPISDYVAVRRAQLGDSGLEQWRKDGLVTLDGVESNYAFLEDARAQCLYDHIRAMASPVYIIHGDADRTVPHAQSIELVRKLHSPCAMWTLHEAGHDYEGAPHQAVLADFLEWSILDRSLAGRQTPGGDMS